MQNTDKALADLLAMLQAKSPEAMAWIADIGYRQSYISGLACLCAALICVGAVCLGVWAIRNGVRLNAEDDRMFSTRGDPWQVFGTIAILVASGCFPLFLYTATIRLVNPGYYVYEMLRALIP